MGDRGALRITGLGHVYPDGTRALAGIDLSVAPGERVALLGENGAGKSTLLLHVNGVLRATEGSLEVDGTLLGDDTVREIRARVGLVFQDPDDQLFMTTVYDDVAFGPLNLGMGAAETDERVHAALHEVGLAEAASKPARHLSFGQRGALPLATVLAMHPSVLVLDEPTSNLDPRARGHLLELLDGLGATMLLATHDMDVAWRLCSRAVVLAGGSVAADGTAREVMGDEALLLANGLELPHAVAAERGGG